MSTAKKHPLQTVHEEAAAETPKTVVTLLESPHKKPAKVPVAKLAAVAEEAATEPAAPVVADARIEAMQAEITDLKEHFKAMRSRVERLQDQSGPIATRVAKLEAAVASWPERLGKGLAAFEAALMKNLGR